MLRFFPPMAPRLFSGGRWQRTALAVLFTVGVLRLLGWGNPITELLLEIRSQAGSDGEVFFARAGEAYDPARRIAFSINPDGRWHTYRLQMPVSGSLDRLRIDPGSVAGTVDLRSVVVETNGSAVALAGPDLGKALGAINLMRAEPGQGTDLRFAVLAPDPYVDFKLPDGAGRTSTRNRNARWFGAGLVAALGWLLLAEYLWPLLRRRLNPHLNLPAAFHRLAAKASDRDALVIPASAMAVVLLVACAAVIYVALNLHQSSIGVWEEMYPAKPVAQRVDIGTPKHIRSDEWNTQAPWVLDQVAQGKSSRNASIGGENAPLLASVPVAHPSAIAQVKFYGFYLFDAETGFSFWWAYKTFGLWLSFFWLFLLLTRGDVASSTLGALWVYGSSFTQWWLSSNLPEILIAFALGIVGAVYLLFARRRVLVAAGACLVAYAVMNLLLHLYPPYIVPLAYLGVAILAGLLLEPDRLSLVRNRWPWRALCFSAAVFVVGVIGGHFLSDALPSIDAMMNTSYPGRRVSSSGDFSLVRLLYGFFEAFRFGESQLPLPPTNASEASSFMILAPLLLLAVPFSAFARRHNGLLVTLALYCLGTSLWIVVPLPAGIEAALQAAGWGWSPPQRAVLGLGIGSIITATVLFSKVKQRTVEVRPIAARRMVPVMVASCLLLFGWGLHAIDPVFFRPPVVVFASAIVATMAAGIVLGRIRLLAIGLAFAVLPALMVNPLVNGLSAVEDKPILLAAKRQGDAPGDRWVVVGDFVFSQGLKMQGLEVITGSQMIPNRETAKVLDPAQMYKAIWNRYAHVALRSDPGLASPSFELIAPDLYVVGLQVCGPHLRRLGVNRIAYTTPIPAADLQCLQPLQAPADSGVRLFRIIPSASVQAP